MCTNDVDDKNNKEKNENLTAETDATVADDAVVGGVTGKTVPNPLS